MSEHVSKPGFVCIEVALDVPLRQTFSYLIAKKAPASGTRVTVPFGRRRLTGVVLGQREQVPEKLKLKAVEAVLDAEPLFSSFLIQLIDWTARYYHHPPGEVWRTAMSSVLRKGLPETHGLSEKSLTLINLPSDWRQKLQRAPVQTDVIEQLTGRNNEVSNVALLSLVPNARNAIQALIKRGWLEQVESLPTAAHTPPEDTAEKLTSDQSDALHLLSETMDRFQCRVLEGITGSGKTEVYFGLIDQCIARGRQSMVMVPEIALTDQLLSRFRTRFGSRVERVHSGMNDARRHRIWWQLSTGAIDIVLCTRSGVFMQFSALGLIIMDEEHDSSFKQHEGLRYHARSVAIKRAQLENIPVVLGSATPALETFNNVKQGRYEGAYLPRRIGASKLPDIQIIDLNQDKAEAGLSAKAREVLQHTLDKKQQALVFINRRGYAPVLYCTACQWTAQCKRCDSQMTTHSYKRSLQCHHCGAIRALPDSCDACGEGQLVELGEGTQKIETQLENCFPEACIQRFDRDNLSTAHKLQQAMDRVHSGEIDILVGTQLLSKGHDFSGVSLVLVINADQGLHSIDFRAPEQLVQQLIQVAGRAGRGEQKGQVLIQSYFPDHPYLQAVRQHDYRLFAEQELEQRELAGFPPFTYMALWRARSKQPDFVMQFLYSVAQQGRQLQREGTFCFDPVQSPMFKRGGQYHAQLLISAHKRSNLHRWLADWIEVVEKSRESSKLHWSIDVDPISLF